MYASTYIEFSHAYSCVLSILGKDFLFCIRKSKKIENCEMCLVDNRDDSSILLTILYNVDYSLDYSV